MRKNTKLCLLLGLVFLFLEEDIASDFMIREGIKVREGVGVN